MGAERPARARDRLRPPSSGPLPLDVYPQARVPRRRARPSAGVPLRVLCVHPLRESVGAPGRIETVTSKERVLSGMRPSGRLHLGNYLGALANWVTLQDTLECFYFVADWHALTDDLHTSDVPGNAVEMVADWLGAGLDPERSTLFIQSLVPEHAELHLLFSMTTPVTPPQRGPTYRERIQQQHPEAPSYGPLRY